MPRKPRTDYDLCVVMGLKMAASLMESFNSTTTHEYRLDDVILCKFNVIRRKWPWKNTKRVVIV